MADDELELGEGELGSMLQRFLLTSDGRVPTEAAGGLQKALRELPSCLLLAPGAELELDYDEVDDGGYEEELPQAEEAGREGGGGGSDAAVPADGGASAAAQHADERASTPAEARLQ